MAAGGRVRIHCGGTAAPGQDAAGELSSSVEQAALIFRLPGSCGVQEPGSTCFKCSRAHRSSQVAVAPSLCLLQDVPHFKFCIFFAGALNRDVHLRHIYEQHIDTPSIHIIGDKVRSACLDR